MGCQLLSIPATFEEFHSLPDFQSTYRAAVEIAHLDDHPALSSRPLRIVDFGGGAGMFHQYLADHFRNSAGHFRNIEDAFSYTNIDLDPDRLSRSPGRQINGDLSFLTLAELPLKPDCIFSLYSAPAIPFGVNYKEYRLWTKRAEVLQAARILGDEGRYVVIGLYPKHFAHGMNNFFDECQTGIGIYEHKSLTLSPESAAALLDFDLNIPLKKHLPIYARIRKKNIENYQKIQAIGFRRVKPAQDRIELSKTLRSIQAILLAEGRRINPGCSLKAWV